jgi:hypothetical protein
MFFLFCCRYREPGFDVDEQPAQRVLKGGSFLDRRDGEDRDDNLKMRISARVGRRPAYTAHNVGFRCAQSISASEQIAYNENGFQIVQLRPPVHHHPNPAETHFIHEKDPREEL